MDRRRWLRLVLTAALLLFGVTGLIACSVSLPAGGPAAEADPVDDPRGTGPPEDDDWVAEPEPDPDPEPGPDPEPVPEPVPGAGATPAKLLELVNGARAVGRTCGGRGWFDATHPLALEARLVSAAQGHSDDMNVNGFFSHTGSDGSSPADRVEREGYAWAAVGETIARGHSTPEHVVSAWLGSDGHCAIIMGTVFTELGAGEVSRHWTLVFARPR